MRLRLDLDRETAMALQDAAFADLRPMPSQAIVLIRRALGLPVPYPEVLPVVPSVEAKAAYVS
jgi:hypothetical protein